MREPFYCGTQRMDWMCRNCDRCVKFNIDIPYDDPRCCPIDAAIGEVVYGKGEPETWADCDLFVIPASLLAPDKENEK